MANILLVDSDDVAQMAMKGILARRAHRFAAVPSVGEAWAFIRRNVKVDLVLVELKLKGEDGIGLIRRLKNDCCLKTLPVAVYASRGDRDSVKSVLSLRAQNFLLKPYRDESVFGEIAKAEANPWRQRHFEHERLVCQATGITPDALRAGLDALRVALEAARASFQQWVEEQSAATVLETLEALLEKAEETGAAGVAACLGELKALVAAAKWSEFAESAEQLEFAARLIADHLDPAHCPEDFLTAEEKNSEKEAQARAMWAKAPAEGRCPMVDWAQLQRQMDSLPGCPVIDSIAAAFKMAATGHPTSLSPLLDLVQKDPSLTAEVLAASNRLKKSKGEGDSLAIEEPRMAVGLLGELRLATLGGSFVVVEERFMLAPPHFSWPNFMAFQLGTGRLARWVCSYLELPSLEAAAYTAGLMHDLGKLLLVRLHPFALQAIHDYALQNGMKLAAAEVFFLGATTHEMAAYFAQKQGLPQRFANVMRWIDNPEGAPEDAELVAVVSLARDLCRHNHVGFNGDTPKDDAVPLEETPEWRVLRSRVYLNFDLKKFEKQAHFECQQLKRDLQGRAAK